MEEYQINWMQFEENIWMQFVGEPASENLDVCFRKVFDRKCSSINESNFGKKL